MNTLVINPGSSTVKFKFFESGDLILTKVLDKYDVGDKVFSKPVRYIKEVLENDIICKTKKVDSIGVRVVHGGKYFDESVKVTKKVLEKIDELSDLAPLHNPISVKVIEELFEEYKNVPIVVVFDTEFHSSIPEYAKQYAIPRKVAKEYSIEKYGFHGTSYKYVYEKAREYYGVKRSDSVVICHLGSGSSICAIKNGLSVDTTMGMTPLDGLIMTTRSGDIDPEIIFYLEEKGYSRSDVKEMLEKNSGLLGIYGKSYDMREIVKHRNKDENAKLAFEMFTYKVAAFIGKYLPAIGGLDVLIFTAGIGEHQYLIRKEVCNNFKFVGLDLDSNLNKANEEGIISTKKSKVKVLMIHTDEEKQIENEVNKVLN